MDIERLAEIGLLVETWRYQNSGSQKYIGELQAAGRNLNIPDSEMMEFFRIVGERLRSRSRVLEHGTIRKVDVEEILDIRHRNLRQEMKSREDARFPGDLDASTWHVAVYPIDKKGEIEGRPISCASFMLDNKDKAAQWQLRGMATDESYRKTGIGTELLVWAMKRIAATSGVHRFWCNARLEAVMFYKKNGWHCVSEPFEIKGVGIHRKMSRVV